MCYISYLSVILGVWAFFRHVDLVSRSSRCDIEESVNKIRQSFSACFIPLHSREKRHFYIIFFSPTFDQCTRFVTYKKSIFLATFFVCITFYFRLLPFIFWQYETRSRTEEKAFWRSRPINRHIFETYIRKIFIIFVYVTSLCWYLFKIK